jgi:proteasome lid subunit RPN8/RPN11
MRVYGIQKALVDTPVKEKAEPVAPQQKNERYVVTECYDIIRRMYEEPQISELCISSRAWIKLMYFIHLVGDYEISGFGRVQKINDMHVVTDFDILKQEVKQAYVESDADAVLDFIRRTPKEERSEWILDWHSHVNMGTSPSGTDWTNYGEMLKARLNKQFPAMIVNKSGSVTSYQIITAAKHSEIKVTRELPSDLTEEDYVAIYSECKEKVETLCRKAVVTTTYSYGKTTGSTWNSSYYNSNHSNYKGTGVGFQEKKSYPTYDSMDDYYDSLGGETQVGKRWWEQDEDEDDDVKAAQEAGYVIEAAEYCPECGNPVAEDDHEFISWGLCRDCIAEYKAQGFI